MSVQAKGSAQVKRASPKDDDCNLQSGKETSEQLQSSERVKNNSKHDSEKEVLQHSVSSSRCLDDDLASLERTDTVKYQDLITANPTKVVKIYRSTAKSSSLTQVINRSTSIEASIATMNRGPKAKVINDKWDILYSDKIANTIIMSFLI